MAQTIAGSSTCPRQRATPLKRISFKKKGKVLSRVYGFHAVSELAPRTSLHLQVHVLLSLQILLAQKDSARQLRARQNSIIGNRFEKTLGKKHRLFDAKFYF
jgi:hypothetical protein